VSIWPSSVRTRREAGDFLLSRSNLSGEGGLSRDQDGAVGLQLGDQLGVLPGRGLEQVRLHHAAVRQLVRHAVADPARGLARGVLRVGRSPEGQHKAG
jgi:hypothetical protein